MFAVNSNAGKNDETEGTGHAGVVLQLDSPAPAPAPVEKEKLNIEVVIDKIGSCQRHVVVTIPRTDIDRYFKKQFDEIAPRAEVPGFRAGKAPRKLLESKFQRQVAEQVKGSLLMDSLSQLTDDQSFAAISEPDLDYEKVVIPQDGPMIFEFNIEVRPEFDMPNWKGLNLELVDSEPTEEVVEEVFGSKFYRKNYEDTTEPVAADDRVQCNIHLLDNGKQVAALESVTLETRNTLFFHDGEITGFSAAVIGKNVGDRFELPVQISEFTDAGEFQGKSLAAEFEILSVSRIAKMPVEEADSDETNAVREMFRTHLRSRLAYEQEQSLREQILEALTKDADWELPPDLLKRQFRRELNRAVMEMRSRGLEDGDISARESELRRNSLENTKRLLQEHFIFERIAEDEKVQDLDSDYNEEIRRIAAASNESERRVRAKLERTGQMDSLRNLIIERKVIDLIREHAQIKKTPFQLPAKKDEFSVGRFLIENQDESIPEARYEDKKMPAIPGVEKDKSNPTS